MSENKSNEVITVDVLWILNIHKYSIVIEYNSTFRNIESIPISAIC